jgi:NADH-quinone oxidoreductase subunit D
MGPQHPSTHGVLRLVLELDGEIVTNLTPIIGYLHTGIEKSAEYRSWVQGTTFFTRMDYLSPLHNELAYCLGVERLLDIEVPARAQAIRVILTEFNRIASHYVWLATGGMELGSTTVMTYGFREREHILDLFESQSGLRMNHAYIRPGGLANAVTDDFVERCEALLRRIPNRLGEFEDLLTQNPIWNDRLRGIGVIDAERALALGVTGTAAPCRRRRPRPAQGRALLRHRAVRLRRADVDRRRLLRALHGAHRGDPPVAAHHPPGARHAADRPRDGRRQAHRCAIAAAARC